MKKILLSTIFLLTCMFYTKAQTLYGTTVNGGSGGGGTINKFVPASNNLTVAKSFDSLNPSKPYKTNLIQANDGKLYGMTESGGKYDGGIIFSYDPSNSIYTKLWDFDYTNGASPEGSLILASNGKLYGMAAFGGTKGYGVIFSFEPSNSIYTKLLDFDYANGQYPYSSLIQASNGKLYGMTIQGGSSGSGVIFSFDPSNSTYTKLKDFDDINGGNPYGSLMQANDGKLYGMTTYGGNYAGVIFSFDISSSTYTKLKDFDYYTSGAYPEGSFIQASDGKLYGMTRAGGSNSSGVIFSFDPSSSTYTKLKDFDDISGSKPASSFIQESNGKLYGTTTSGGSSNAGVIFSFDPSTSTYTKLKDFDYPNGGGPYGGLMQASNGKLYGMTTFGGSTDAGVIFSFDLSGSTYLKLKDFGINEDGRYVYGSLMQASDGKLYGMTNEGGIGDAGVIFSFNPSTSTYKKLKDFDNTNGGNPYGSLTQASNGKLYGMTAYGGSGDAGVIFSFDPATSIYTKLKDFDIISGGNPSGRLLQASNGKLYGMTVFGGSSDYGVIFSFDPSTSNYTKLMDFNGTNGSKPFGSLIQAANGKLYGMTSEVGSSNNGVIFSFDPATSIYKKLKDFDGTNGSYPYGSLMQAKDGKLYGMTFSGGSNNAGIIFSFDLSASSFTKLKDLDSTNGSKPSGNLIQVSNGKLYGMTSDGGSSGVGVIFSFDPSTSTFTKLKDFDDTNGANPLLASFIEVAEGGPVPVSLISFTGKNKGSSNLLSWKVENELNLDYYELQRSIDGQNFTSVSQIKATGNSVYSYNDQLANAVSPVYFYRLKSVDNDGNFKYSVIIKIGTNLNGKFATVNPNPFKDRLMVTVETFIAGNATFIISDLGGKQLYKEIKQVPAGTNVVSIDEVGKLSRGTYLLTIITSQQTQSIKVIKGY